MSITTIVAALALEIDDDPVVGRAIQLAQQHDARLIVIHVVEDLGLGEQSYLPINHDALKEILSSEASDQLKRLFEGMPVSPEILIRAGRPHEVIDELAKQNNAELVLIGPGKARSISERVFGSTADRVVRTSSCPVLVVRRRTTEAYQHVVAAVDFSDMSRAAGQLAARFAPTATMDLVHIVEINFPFERAMWRAGAPQADVEGYRRARGQSARKQLLEMFSNGDGPLNEARVRVILGVAGDVLVRLARRGETDLLALGTQGRSALQRFVFGSVARKVLAAASCDVLVVPASSVLRGQPAA